MTSDARSTETDPQPDPVAARLAEVEREVRENPGPIVRDEGADRIADLYRRTGGHRDRPDSR